MSTSPKAEDVRAALERVLASPTFAQAHRSRAFLTYVTEETLAGRADMISGYTIARAAFDKAVDFDAAADPIVRVEAGRLRSRLREYYDTGGAADSVRIALQRGTYVPTFSFVDDALPLRPDVSRPRLQSTAMIALATVIIAGLVVAVGLPYMRVGPSDVPPQDAVATDAANPRGAARILVQPFRNIGDQQSLPLAFGMSEEVMTRLARYRNVTVFVGASGYFDGKPAVEPLDSSNADYLLTGSVDAGGDAIHVSPRLVDSRTGQQVWADKYDLPFEAATVWSIVDAVASAVATTLGEPYGPLFDAEVARVQGATEHNVDAYHCLLRFLFALQAISDDSLDRATACFEHVVAMDPMSSESWSRLAALYRMEYLQNFDPETEAAAPPLDRALEAARRALDIDHDNVFALEELAFISLLRDDPVGFETSIARALALNPSADIRAAIGINFVKMGQAERGFAMIEQGMAESPRAPPFFFVGYVVHALRTGDDEAAFRWAQRMSSPGWPLSQVVLAAVAARTGRDDIAQRARDRLLELRPTFADNGRELITRGRLGADVEAVLFDGLARAGLPLH